MKRKILAGLLTLCMAAGMAVPAAAATTPAEQEPGADGPQYTLQDHVLNKANNWDISNELIMPGESFTTQYDLDYVQRNCSCVTADYQYWKYVTYYTFDKAGLYLGDPNTNTPHTPRYVYNQLKGREPDLTKLEPISEEYNAVDIMFGGNYEELQKEIGDNEIYDNVKGQLEALANDPSASVRINIGYVNNTGLPMMFVEPTLHGGLYSDELDEVEGWHVGHGGVSWAYRYQGLSNIRFLEPYYNISYEGVEDFTEEELAALPDRYYVQREEQQLVFPNPTRAGYHFREWSVPGYDRLILNMDETVTVEDGATIVTLNEDNFGKYYYNAEDKTLMPKFDRGDTVTFNPNGGALKDGEKAVREIDETGTEDSKFFDVSTVAPVREGYTFAGWSFSPSGERNSIIANTANSDWFADWESYYRSLQYGENPASTSIYDIQLYAVWEKNVTELTDSDTNVSISLTDGVPEDATLSADTIAQESVLESRPELKEELPGLLSIYDISVRQNGEPLEIKDNPMTVKIPLNDHLKGYKYYQAVYLGDPLERFDAVVDGDFLVFETDHLSQYAIIGSNTPFETSEQPTDPTDPTTPTDPAGPTDPTTPTDPADPAEPTDPAKPEQQGKPSEQIESPQTGDSSNMALWISLMMVSCGGVLGMLFYKRKKTAAGK